MIKRIKSCSILLLVFAFSYGQVDTKALDQYYAQMVKDWDVPSASIGIVKDGKLVFTGNYGVKEVGTNDAPDSNTLYAIASNSKSQVGSHQITFSNARRESFFSFFDIRFTCLL